MFLPCLRLLVPSQSCRREERREKQQSADLRPMGPELAPWAVPSFGWVGAKVSDGGLLLGPSPARLFLCSAASWPIAHPASPLLAWLHMLMAVRTICLADSYLCPPRNATSPSSVPTDQHLYSCLIHCPFLVLYFEIESG